MVSSIIITVGTLSKYFLCLCAFVIIFDVVERSTCHAIKLENKNCCMVYPVYETCLIYSATRFLFVGVLARTFLLFKFYDADYGA